MKKRLFVYSSISVTLFLAGFMVPVSGHGLGSVESDLLKIDNDYLKVLVETNPDVLDENTNEIDFEITTINDDTGELLTEIEYHIVIFDAQSNTELLSFDAFSPGERLYSKIIPSQTLEFIGEKTENDSLIGSNTNPFEIHGPLFEGGGLVQVNVSIVSIAGKSVQSSDNTFETLLTIGEYIPFEIEYENSSYELLFATYFDKIEEFNFDSKSNTLTALMPFNWEKEFVEKIPYVHAEYYVPKSVSVFKNHDIIMTINDIQILGTIDRSPEDEIVVHFLIPTKKLVQYSEQMSPDNFNQIIFGIEPGSPREEEKADAALEQGEKAIKLSTKEDWKLHLYLEPGGKINPNKEIRVNLEFHDPVTNSIVPDITYDIDLFLNGDLLISESELHTPDGKDIYPITFDSEGAVIIRVSNINNYDTFGEFAFKVTQVTQEKVDAVIVIEIAEDSAIPGCEEDNSCYLPYEAKIQSGDYVTWTNSDVAAHTVTSGIPSDGGPNELFDSGIMAPNQEFSYEFVNDGIHDYYCSLHPWMIGIVHVGESIQETFIPEWVKNNARWWADGNIDDSTFASGIEFMIKQGIVSVPPTEQKEKSDTTIPDWVRNNADWWEQGLISDDDFAAGLQYLVANGIISV